MAQCVDSVTSRTVAREPPPRSMRRARSCGGASRARRTSRATSVTSPGSGLRTGSADRARSAKTSGRDAGLYSHTEKGVGCADEAPGDGHGLTDVPHDRDRDQVGATALRFVVSNVIGPVRHEDIGPGLDRPVAAVPGIGA